MLRRWLSVSLLLLLAVASLGTASGCGSDSSASSLPKKEFVKRANKICVDTEFEQLGEAQKYSSKHPNAEEAALIKPALVPTLKKEINELEALG
jgi:hypothetical protein